MGLHETDESGKNTSRSTRTRVSVPVLLLKKKKKIDMGRASIMKGVVGYRREGGGPSLLLVFWVSRT